MIFTEPAYRRTTVMPHPEQKPLCQSGNRISPDKKEMTGRFRKTFSMGTRTRRPDRDTRLAGERVEKTVKSPAIHFPDRQKNAPVQPDKPVVPSKHRPPLRPSASPPMYGTDVFSTRQGKTLLDTSPVLQNTFTVYNRFRSGIPMNLFRISPSPCTARKSGAKAAGRRYRGQAIPAAGHPPPVRHLRRDGNGTAHPCGHRARRFSSSMVAS